jgi:dienelactone hydrolase
MRALAIAALSLLCAAPPALAQVNLGFPKQARHSVPMPGSGLLTGSALFAPQGAGPFPAIVISHACAGLRQNSFEWAARAVEAGYVALVVDHLGPRNVAMNCYPNIKVNYNVIAQDSIAGMKHLRTLPFVDGKRIGHMGFSMGAMAGLRITSPSFRKGHVGGEGFAAVVAFYPFCANSLGPDGKMDVNLNSDTDTPLLLLLGEKDDEASPAVCVQQAKANAADGRPVSWKVYPNTTHSFDNSLLGDRPFVREGGGRKFIYRYSAKSTEAAWQDARAFLARYLGGRKPQ